jgi:hypothetical protein
MDNNFIKNLIHSRKNVSKDVRDNIIEKFLPNNCNVRGCLEPWTFVLKSFDNNNYNCKKYCVNHSDDWIKNLFVNPYYITIDNVKYENTELIYILTFYNPDFIQIQIRINKNNVYFINYHDFKNNIYKKNYTKSEIIDIIKNNIKYINLFQKEIGVEELGNLYGLNYKIYNKYTNTISEFKNIIYKSLPEHDSY